MADVPFRRLAAAYDRGIERAKGKVFKTVYERFHGGLVPPGKVLSKEETVQKWAAVREQDPYYTQFFNDRFHFLKDKFAVSEKDAALQAWDDVRKIDDDLQAHLPKLGKTKEPAMVPVGTVTQSQGTDHNGYDVAYPDGFPVEAPTDGLAVDIGSDKISGNYIIVGTHRPDVWNWYYTNKGMKPVTGKGSVVLGHLSSINVQRGQRIEPGQIIGAVGNTGKSTAPHLHIQAGSGKPYDRDTLVKPNSGKVIGTNAEQAISPTGAPELPY